MVGERLSQAELEVTRMEQARVVPPAGKNSMDYAAERTDCGPGQAGPLREQAKSGPGRALPGLERSDCGPRRAGPKLERAGCAPAQTRPGSD